MWIFPLSLGSFIVGIFLLRSMWKHPSSGILGIFFLIVLGEFGRLSFFPMPILALDFFVLLFCCLWFIKSWWHGSQIHIGKLFFPFILFCVTALFSLLFNMWNLDFSEVLLSFSYLVRFIGYFALYIIASNEKIKPIRFLNILLGTALFLALGGFIQLIIFPDFTGMQTLGWDPHIGRLLSTWFDPNYLGGFFAFVLIILTNVLFRKEMLLRRKITLVGLECILLVGLYLTFSRSAYLMFFIGLLLTGIFRSPKVLFGCAILAILSITIIPRAQERIENLFGSTFAFLTNTYDYGLDETAKLRVESWQQGWDIFTEHPFLGVGYNTLRYVRQNKGMIMDDNVHSGSGFDSSILTLLATTGILGTLLFLIGLVRMIFIFFTSYRQEENTTDKDFSLGFLFSLCALLVHSVFVNSLLLSYFLTILFLGTGIMEYSWRQKCKNMKKLPVS